MKKILVFSFLIFFSGCLSLFPRVETKFPIGHARLVKIAPMCIDPNPYQYEKCFNMAKLLETPEGEKLEDQVIKDIMYGQIRLGMTKEMVLRIWPRPDKINKTVGSWGVHEQWVYDYGSSGFKFLYFENGKLVSWQSF